MATRAGVDQIAQGMGGLMSITGQPGRGPMRVGIPIDDLTAGNLLALGIMMALFDRERTGVGRWVHDVAAGGADLHARLPGQPLADGGRGGGPGRQRPPDRHPHRRVPDQRRPHQHRRQLVARVRPASARRSAGRTGWPRRNGRRRRAAASDRASRSTPRSARSPAPSRPNHWIELFEAQRHPLRADLHDRPGVRRSAGEASRHGAHDAQSGGRREARWSPRRSTSPASPRTSACRRRRRDRAPTRCCASVGYTRRGDRRHAQEGSDLTWTRVSGDDARIRRRQDAGREGRRRRADHLQPAREAQRHVDGDVDRAGRDPRRVRRGQLGAGGGADRRRRQGVRFRRGYQPVRRRTAPTPTRSRNTTG